LDVINLMDAREQVDLDYARARRRALIGRLVSWVRRRCASLRAFDTVRRERGADNRRYVGLRTVEVDRVIGSVGRSRDFDSGFMPTRASEVGWKSVDLAFRTGRDLPPIALNKVGDSYFVVDGDHRVSVARYHGVEWIDAEVTEFFPSREAEKRRAIRQPMVARPSERRRFWGGPRERPRPSAVEEEGGGMLLGAKVVSELNVK